MNPFTVQATLNIVMEASNELRRVGQGGRGDSKNSLTIYVT